MKLTFILGYTMYIKLYTIAYKSDTSYESAWKRILYNQKDFTYVPSMHYQEALKYFKTIKQLW